MLDDYVSKKWARMKRYIKIGLCSKDSMPLQTNKWNPHVPLLGNLLGLKNSVTRQGLKSYEYPIYIIRYIDNSTLFFDMRHSVDT